MKMTFYLKVCLLILWISALPTSQAQGQQREGRFFKGSSILHWSVRKTLEPVEPAAEDGVTRGQIALTHKSQGQAEKQGLMMRVTGLEPDTMYQFWVRLADTEDYLAVQEFTTSSRGSAMIRSKKIKTRRGLHELKPSQNLPASLDPLENIEEVVIANDEDVVILRADLSEPERFQYLIKRPLDNAGFDEDAAAVLRVRGHQERAWFTLNMMGLDPNATYVLRLNGEAFADLLTDESGRADSQSYLDMPTDILRVESLEILDQADNLILSTQLPSP